MIAKIFKLTHGVHNSLRMYNEVMEIELPDDVVPPHQVKVRDKTGAEKLCDFDPIITKECGHRAYSYERKTQTKVHDHVYVGPVDSNGGDDVSLASKGVIDNNTSGGSEDGIR